MADTNQLKREVKWWGDEVDALEGKLSNAKQKFADFERQLDRAEDEEKREKAAEASKK